MKLIACVALLLVGCAGVDVDGDIPACSPADGTYSVRAVTPEPDGCPLFVPTSPAVFAGGEHTGLDPESTHVSGVCTYHAALDSSTYDVTWNADATHGVGYLHDSGCVYELELVKQ